MGALALVVGIRLAKPGVYVLNETGAEATPEHVLQAFRICRAAVLYGVMFTFVLRVFGVDWAP